MRTPPTFTNSAVTSSTFIALIFSTSAGGNVFSIPNKIPIFFIPSLSLCHSESGGKPGEEPASFPHRHRRPKNTSPPSSTTAASHASHDLHKWPANGEPLSHSTGQRTSRSGPDICPNPPIPAQSSSAGSGSKTNRRSDSANSPLDN